MLSLELLCIRILIKCKDYLGDIGYLPLHLLQPVLQRCSAGDLFRIEEETRAGGRNIHPEELDVHWQRVFIEDFGQPSCASQVHSQTANSTATSSSSAVANHWKQTYQARQAEFHEKWTRVGQKVRRMWEEERRKKESRCVQVIDMVPRRGLKRPSPQSKPPPPASSRDRLAKKLRINPVSWRTSPTQLPSSNSTTQESKTVLPLMEHGIHWGDGKNTTDHMRGVTAGARMTPDKGIIATCKAVRLMEVDIDWENT